MRVADLRVHVGPGDARRPAPDFRAAGSAWVAEATQAMRWVAEERGLGGARVLDGMSWDLAIDEVWEAWVDAFVADLAPRCGLAALRRGTTTRRLNWATPTTSMRMLVPDSGLRGAGRLAWVDAKYKAHLQLLAHRGWSGLEETTRQAHRADLHQALAYGALDEVERVDSVLVYPELAADDRSRPAIATVAAGRRRVRLVLIGLPFGFRSPEHRETTMAEWRELLAA
jgi:5-methylcytosine-specific restriction endonuclease McrBC regulatory subunit McrC